MDFLKAMFSGKKILRSILLIVFLPACGLILLEAFLRLGGAVFFLEQEKINKRSLDKENNYVIVCLGESMTAGGGLSSYPRQLEDNLNSLGLEANFSVVNRGIPSANSGMILARAGEVLDRYRPDMLVVMMGVSDHFAILDIAGAVPPEAVAPVLSRSRVYRLATQVWKDAWKTLWEFKDPEARKKMAEKKSARNSLTAYQRSQSNFYAQKGDEFFDEDENIEENRSKAVAMYKRALEFDPELPRPLLRLGISYRELGKHRQAGEAFRRALELESVRYQALVEWGNNYRDRRLWSEAAALYERAIALEPRKAAAYLEWGRGLLEQERRPVAFEKLLRALRLEPFNRLIYQELEKQVVREEGGETFEQALKEVLRTAPDSVNFNHLLAELYLSQGKEKAAEALYRSVIERSPEAFWAHTCLGNLYQSQGKIAEAEELYSEADRWRRRNNATAENYQRLQKIVAARGIPLVCVQYPLEKVAELKSMLSDQPGVFFVDNEEVFREAVEREGFDTFFFHKFPGRIFGHCNPRGNRLLARNIASTLLRGPLREVVGPGRRTSLPDRRGGGGGRINELLSPLVKVEGVSRGEDGREVSCLNRKQEGEAGRVYLERCGDETEVTVDFGKNNKKNIKALASHHPEDPAHLHMAEHYFQGAELFGSADGADWKLVAPADHLEWPGDDGWRFWEFNNQSSFRYYRIFLPAGKYRGLENYLRNVNELAMFE